MLKDELLYCLYKHAGSVSGGELSRTFGVSRAAVNKAAHKLMDEGIPLTASHSGGYTLSPGYDLLTARTVSDCLDTRCFGRSMEVLDNVVSTNSYLRAESAGGKPGAALPEGHVAVAYTQSGGRGRQNRAFACPCGGLYFSLLLRPGFAAGDITVITVLAAVAVCRAIEELTGLNPKIKWVNDIFIGDKKLCGILTEASIEGETGTMESAVLGIGINANLSVRDFPPGLAGVVTTLYEHTGGVICRSRLLALILHHLEGLYDGLGDPILMKCAMEEYRKRMFILGRKIEVIAPAGDYIATAVDVDDRGQLIVRGPGGEISALSSNEVRIISQ